MDLEQLFASDLFQLNKASRDELRTYARVLWPIQVSFIVGLPVLCGELSAAIGKLALQGDQIDEEIRLKRILRIMFHSTADELGQGRDRYGVTHHDLFASQVNVCTGLTPKLLRESWIRGTANRQLAEVISASMQSVKEGLHMMYVVENLVPRFFVHQERLFLSASEPQHVFHSTMHKETEILHAGEAHDFMKNVERDENLIREYLQLWRGLCDEIHQHMQELSLNTRAEFRAPRVFKALTALNL